jgi:hypothetical protein
MIGIIGVPERGTNSRLNLGERVAEATNPQAETKIRSSRKTNESTEAPVAGRCDTDGDDGRQSGGGVNV